MTNVLRRVCFTLAFGLIFVFLQGTLLKAFWPGMIVPGLSLVLVVFLAFYETSILGAVLAFLLGLELDLFSGVALGPWAGAYVLIFGLLSMFSSRIFIESPAAIAFTVLVSSLVSNIVFMLIIAQVDHSVLVVSWALFVEALLTALFCVPLFAIFRRTLLSAPGPGRRLGMHA